jgi:hypothetical protein
LLKKDLIKRGANIQTIDYVDSAIRFHKWTMTPKSAEGWALRDADKLDFISIERWKSCLDTHQLEHLKAIKILLPLLRDNLHYEISKRIYDERIEAFNASKVAKYVH